MDHETRRDKVRKALRKVGVDALLVTDFTNVTYLTGFTGDDSYLLVRDDGDPIIERSALHHPIGRGMPGRRSAHPQAGRQHFAGRSTRAAIGEYQPAGHRGRFDDRGLGRQDIGQTAEDGDRATSGLVEKLRQIKDKDEIELTREAVWQAEKAFGVIRASLAAGDDRKADSGRFGASIAAVRGQGTGFSVTRGGRSAGGIAHMPRRATTGSRKATFVLVDWGASEGLYRSDLTRMLVTGRISPKFAAIYEIVLEAQTKAIDAIRPGVFARTSTPSPGALSPKPATAAVFATDWGTAWDC